MGQGSREIRIALLQLRCDGDPSANLEKALVSIATATAEGAELVCLPELFRTRYFCQSEDERHFDLAEPIPGETSEALAKAAKDFGISILGSIFERRQAGLYHNTALVIAPDGEIVCRYRKMHIPDDPLYYEKFYFTPGDPGRTPDLLGPMVSRSGAPFGSRGGGITGLSDGDWLGDRRSPRVGAGRARRLGDDPAEPRHRQRRFCSGGQSGR
jgi:predicted amidohydrolase